MRIMTWFIGIATLALIASGCSGSTNATATAPSPSQTPPPTASTETGFAVTSAEFVDGGNLPESVKASAFGGQCKGANVSPALAWTGAPEGTAAYAITLIDTDADGFVHWTKADIPAAVTEVAAGGADALSGVGGQTGHSSGTYFGPCPPGGEHRYVVTVYALDAPLGLGENFGIVDLRAALEGHALAEATITGLASHTG